MTITNTNRPNIKPNIKKQNAPRQKIPKRISETYLHNSGLYYLERYAASSAHFRSVMLRKVKRSCMHHTDQDYESCANMVEALTLKFEQAGLLNDRLYLEGMVRSLRRKGLSSRMIHQKLRQKGLNESNIHKALSEYDTQRTGHAPDFIGAEDISHNNGMNNASHNPEHAELSAAATYCRRKKLGAYTPIKISALCEGDAAAFNVLRDKQLAKLARAGFGFDVAKKALALDLEECENLQSL